MRIYNEEGGVAAMKALHSRFKKCRPGYQIIFSGSGEIEGLKLCDGSFINKENMTKNIDLL